MLKGLALSQINATNPLSSADFRALQSRGCQVIRIEATPSLDVGYTRYFDAHNVKLLLLLGRSIIPTVSSRDLNGPLTGPTWPKVLAAWKKAVEETLTRVAATHPLPYCEVWSEENGNITATGTGVKPANYAALFDVAYPLIRAHNADTRIITGGVFAHATSGVEYLRRVQALSHYFPYADAVGWHPYLDINGGLQTAHVLQFLGELHTLTGKNIFLTETGWSLTQTTQEIQRDNLASLFATCRASGIVDGILVFTLKDSPESVPPLAYGIQGRLAWDHFKEW